MEGVAVIYRQRARDGFCLGLHHRVSDERVCGHGPVFVGFGRACCAEPVFCFPDPFPVCFVVLPVAASCCGFRVGYIVDQGHVGDVHDLRDLPDRYVVVVSAAAFCRGRYLHIEATGIKHDGGVGQEVVNEVVRHPDPGRYNNI